jgi:flagellar export protein FliJ
MSKQLALVLDLREKEEEKARQVLGASEKQLELLQQQLKALEDYALAYQQQLSTPGQMQMQHRQTITAYLHQVQTAVMGQIEKVAFATKQVEQAKKIWLDARLQKKGIQTLMDKRQREQRIVNEKNEQKESDAFNQAAFYRNKS